MKVIILAAGQGTRLRPLTDEKPKCMVEVLGKSIIDRQIESMKKCGIKENDIYILAGYRADALEQCYHDTGVHLILNPNYDSTNMVYTLMCAKELMEKEEDIIISYGDIFYSPEVFERILSLQDEMGVIVDNGWYDYWKKRCENLLDDAETLKIDEHGYLTEIGKKTTKLSDVQSQYIGLIRVRGNLLHRLIGFCQEAEQLESEGKQLENMLRSYRKMYMTDLLQYMIEHGAKLKALEINRGWYEIDNPDDLKVAEEELQC